MGSFKIVTRSKPVTDQVEDILRERILSGIYPIGERIPSEDNLAEELQVSRATIRSALTAITTEGLIRRRQGDGTYVISHLKNREPIKRAWVFSDFLETNGRERKTQEMERVTRQPTVQEAEDLRLNPDERVLLTAFMTLIDQKPVIFATHTYREDSQFPDQAGQQEKLPLTEFIDVHDGSLFGLVQVHFKGVITDGGNIPEEIVPPGTPLLKIEAVLCDPSGEPFILVNEFHIRGEGYLATIAHPVF
ncbi:MAG: GntR family transcriptional regulator [Anaerolineaceae bacterium]|nr:GntR family transcriptional regulator [Anaerolineaceae bacterium]